MATQASKKIENRTVFSLLLGSFIQTQFDIAAMSVIPGASKSVKIHVMSNALVIFCTCPDEDVASRLANGLVETKLAACVNILPGIRSIYRWQGTVSDDSEVLLVIKSLVSRFEEVEAWLLEHHPYDVPEVLALPVERGSADYLAWIESSVGK